MHENLPVPHSLTFSVWQVEIEESTREERLKGQGRRPEGGEHKYKRKRKLYAAYKT